MVAAVAIAAAAACLLLLARCVLLLAVKRRFQASKRSSIKTMIVLGSGGHTAEMLMLVEGLDRSFYSPRVYVAAETDSMSGKRSLSREQEWAAADASLAADEQAAGNGHATSTAARRQQQAARKQPQAASAASSSVAVEVIPRSREVGQSYVTSVFTTLYSLAWAAWMVTRVRPQLVLVNGPGTCIPVCAAAFLSRLVLLADCRIVYVESIARVRKLSLSGRILYASRLADQFFVQWPELQARYPRSTYAGRLY